MKCSLRDDGFAAGYDAISSFLPWSTSTSLAVSFVRHAQQWQQWPDLYKGMSRTFFSLRRRPGFDSRHPAPLTKGDACLVSGRPLGSWHFLFFWRPSRGRNCRALDPDLEIQSQSGGGTHHRAAVCGLPFSISKEFVRWQHTSRQHSKGLPNRERKSVGCLYRAKPVERHWCPIQTTRQMLHLPGVCPSG